MLRLDAIRDPETLRQVAVLLERENDTLHAKLQTLTAELARLRGAAAVTAQHDLAFLKELLAQRERALFGPSSEQRPPPAAPAPPPAAPPRRGHGPQAQPRLPRVDVVHELAADDRTCAQCGGTLREMTGQTEDAEEITVVERRFVLVTHRRKKYRCACNGCVETAPGPLRLATRPDTRGCRYAPAVAVEIATAKYLDHLPLERQTRIMRREGLTIDSQTLWDQIEALATVLTPTYGALRRHVLAAPVVGADETVLGRPALQTIARALKELGGELRGAVDAATDLAIERAALVVQDDAVEELHAAPGELVLAALEDFARVAVRAGRERSTGRAVVERRARGRRRG